MFVRPLGQFGENDNKYVIKSDIFPQKANMEAEVERKIFKFTPKFSKKIAGNLV